MHPTHQNSISVFLCACLCLYISRKWFLYCFIRLVYSKQVCTHHQNSVCVCVCVIHTHNHYHHPHQSSASFSVCVCLSVSVFNGFMVIYMSLTGMLARLLLSRTCPTSFIKYPSVSWVAHMKQEALQTAAREEVLPAIFQRTWQAENPEFLLCRTRPTSACHCCSPSGLPANFGALPTVQLRAHLPILDSHGNKMILMGT